MILSMIPLYSSIKKQDLFLMLYVFVYRVYRVYCVYRVYTICVAGSP